LFLLAGSAFLAGLLAGREGLGVTTDSVTYVAEARHVLDGEGLLVPAGLHEIYGPVATDADLVLTGHFPPLYPVVLALTGAARDPVRSGRWLNAVLLGVSAVLVALLVLHHRRSRWAAVGAAACFVLSPITLRVHSMVWSESLFVALGLLGLLQVAGWIVHRRQSMLAMG
jgi:hypothetical protein